jgi:hypothetical protein
MSAHLRPDRAIIALPSHGHQTLVGVQWPHAEFERLRADVEANFMATATTLSLTSTRCSTSGLMRLHPLPAESEP